MKFGEKIKFPNLLVNTTLKTGKVKSKLYEEGHIFQSNGNKILDTFLGLPNEALAELQWGLNIESSNYITHISL